MVVRFKVLGRPLALKRHRIGRGNRCFDPSAADKRKLLARALPHAPEVPFGGAIAVTVEFAITRPKSHYRTGRNKHLLKKGAATFPRCPDVDNLLKFVLDALNASPFYADDCQVVRASARKVYTAADTADDTADNDDDAGGYTDVRIADVPADTLESGDFWT